MRAKLPLPAGARSALDFVETCTVQDSRRHRRGARHRQLPRVPHQCRHDSRPVQARGPAPLTDRCAPEGTTRYASSGPDYVVAPLRSSALSQLRRTTWRFAQQTSRITRRSRTLGHIDAGASARTLRGHHPQVSAANLRTMTKSSRAQADFDPNKTPHNETSRNAPRAKRGVHRGAPAPSPRCAAIAWRQGHIGHRVQESGDSRDRGRSPSAHCGSHSVAIRCRLIEHDLRCGDRRAGAGHRDDARIARRWRPCPAAGSSSRAGRDRCGHE